MPDSLRHTAFALLLLGLLLLIGRVALRHLRPLRDFFIPGSIIAGLLALLLGPQALGALVSRMAGEGAPGSQGLFPRPVLDTWAELPELLISVVFASLFLGKKIPPLKKIWSLAGPQVAFGQTVAWGQYVLGTALALALLVPVFGLSPLSGALLEIGFEGGHGTAAGLSSTFEELDFPEGEALTLGLATTGLAAGILFGIFLVNWKARSGRGDPKGEDTAVMGEGGAEEASMRQRGEESRDSGESHEDDLINPLSVHLGFVSLAILAGRLIQLGLVWMEERFWGGEGGIELFDHLPLFPLAMVGGVLMQLMLDRVGYGGLIRRPLVERISGASLDMTVAAALATLSLSAIGEHFIPFALLAAAGIAWNCFAFLVLAPRMIPEHWFERGIGDMGQSMGMTVTGLLLIRVADPEGRAQGVESFGYKQLLFEPVVGGGLFTATSMPLIHQFGLWPVLTAAAVLCAVWMSVGLLHFGRKG